VDECRVRTLEQVSSLAVESIPYGDHGRRVALGDTRLVE
jgi:hypothetical protein